MDQRQIESEVRIGADAGVENVLRSFWEKARAAGELIARLREEKKGAERRLREMEQEVASLNSEIQSKEQELKRLRAEHVQLTSSNGREFFTAEEKEILRGRIRELIAKINSHL